MRYLKKGLKLIALFLSGLILLQSCSVYKMPVSLEQAAQQEKRVKLVTADDEVYKFKYIVYEDGQFYGIKANSGEEVKIPINTEEVTNVLMKKGLPWWAWTLIVVGGLFVIGLTICLIDGCGVDISGGWGY